MATADALWLALAALGVWFWIDSLRARERAVRLCSASCRARGVQLLDQTVHATGLRLRRHANGWLGLERTFRFEYSRDGADRHVGRLVLHGSRMVGFSGPVAPASGRIEAEVT